MRFNFSRWELRRAISLLAVTIMLPGAVLTGSAEGTATTTPENSVVKIFSTVRYPDFFKPWTKQAASEVTGTGVVIRGKRILSNAHVVQYASQVQIQANQAGEKISAIVESIAPEMDLAVLRIEDESFFDTHAPMEFEKKLPTVRDSVVVYGYPTGGSSLSVTKGIVSRIEFTPAGFSAGSLWIQIDAAINPGNSGGPAVAGDKMMGLAFSRLNGADNIGYIIPCEEIELFLTDVADGKYDGKPAIFDDLQTLENPALRSFLKLDKSTVGIVVHKPNRQLPNNPLQEWDLITKIGTLPVDEEGQIKVNGNLRLRFSYLIQSLAKDGKFPLTVLRAGKELQLDMPTAVRRPIVLQNLANEYPSYFIYGPLVFSTASLEFVQALRGEEAYSVMSMLSFGGSPLITRMFDAPAFPGENFVIVSSPFFPHKLAMGYSSPIAQTVKTVNGVPIKNLAHLVEVFRDLQDEFVRIEFDSRGTETLVFRRAEMQAATEDILNDNGVRSQGSANTMAIWNQKAKAAAH
jgi:S1-C subfamily serine protease